MGKRRKEQRRNILLRVPEALAARLDARAAELSRPRTYVIYDALVEALRIADAARPPAPDPRQLALRLGGRSRRRARRGR